MSFRRMRSLALVLCLPQFVGCGRPPNADTPDAPEPAAYLLAWAGDQDEREGDSNFLAVIDVDPASTTYRQIVATAPIGMVGGMPHHSEAEADSAWRYPFEVKFIADDRTAMMNTFYCGFYLLTELDGDEPRIERVMVFEDPKYTWCGVPVVIGHYWIMPVTEAREVVVLDIADPRNPTVVSRLAGDSTFMPHWAARDPGSDRVVFTSHADEDPARPLGQVRLYDRGPDLG